MSAVCPKQVRAATTVQQRWPTRWTADGTCSYCGSISQALFLDAIDAGCELVPTDKPYKVYVLRPDPRAGAPRINGKANFEPTYGTWTRVTAENIADMPTDGLRPELGSWVDIGPTPDRRQDKFYFEHLDADGRKTFIDRLNSGGIKLAAPGRFYVLPYFVGGDVR